MKYSKNSLILTPLQSLYGVELMTRETHVINALDRSTTKEAFNDNGILATLSH